MTNIATIIGYEAAEAYRRTHRCFYCGGSLIVETELEDFDYGNAECLLCSRVVAKIIFRLKRRPSLAELRNDPPKRGRPPKAVLV